MFKQHASPMKAHLLVPLGTLPWWGLFLPLSPTLNKPLLSWIWGIWPVLSGYRDQSYSRFGVPSTHPHNQDTQDDKKPGSTPRVSGVYV